MDQIAKYWGMSGSAAAAMACSGGEAPSWEEQAFARDAAACSLVWPPRSYSCSFCRREFRSAQALGGHMNVHRRDRARLRAARGDDGGAVDEEDQPPRHQDQHYGMVDVRAVLSNPSTAAAPSSSAMATTAAPSPSPSYLSAIIRESKNTKFLMPVAMAVARERQAIYKHDHGIGGEDDESARRRMKKRRRVDLSPSPPPPPIFLRSRAAAAAALVDLHLHLHLDPKVPQGFGLGDHAKVAEATASPSSSSTLVDQQEVDLELRLGTSC